MFNRLKAVFLAFMALIAMAVSGPAAAALPEAVTTAVTAAGTDLVAGATALIVAMVGFWGIKKLGTKLGWW